MDEGAGLARRVACRLDGLVVHGPLTHMLVGVWRDAPVGLSGDGTAAGTSPSPWVVVPALIAVGALLCFIQWRIWASQRAFTRKVATPRGPALIRGEPEDVKRPGDQLWKSLIRTRPGWGRPWILTVSGPGAPADAHPPERYLSRREALERARALSRDLSAE